MNIHRWLSAATKEIRFTPDRNAVQDELRAHYDDRLEHYLARGMGEKEAAQAALDGMGDPAEIAPQLGRIHTPWWGYLWRASRVMLVLAAILLVLHLPRALDRSGILRNYYTAPNPRVGFSTSINNTHTYTTLSVVRPTGSARLGNYRFSAPVVELQQYSRAGEDGTEQELCILYIYLKSSTWRFWEPSDQSQYMILRNMVTDSHGNQYARGELYPNEHEALTLFCRIYQGLPGTTWYQLELDLPDTPLPDWVDIPIGYGGETVRVDLKEGVVR